MSKVLTAGRCAPREWPWWTNGGGCILAAGKVVMVERFAPGSWKQERHWEFLCDC